ncbi:MAG: energy-coupled thiamine transporter ThiT [Oscillospiraceae bacterium]|nr:energy-coupled thiamine transporter ThiT [Oscillospiraceae bacterium]
MRNERKEEILSLVEGAMMIALATALSFVKIVEFPWGGAITLLSMLPIVLYSIRRGVVKGLSVSFAYAVLQMMLDIAEVFSLPGLTPASLIGCLLLDYLVPFTLIGLAGLFRERGLSGWVGGAAFALSLRLLSHYFSGVFIFASTERVMNINISNPYLYSLAYNAAYMVPEIAFTCVACFVLFKIPSTRRLLTEKMPA